MNSRIARTLVLAIIGVASITTAALAQKRPDAQSTLQDAEILNLVQHALGEKNIRGLQVAVKDEVVTLTGQVPSLWAEQQAIKTARKTNDVRQVVDRLSVVRGESD